MFKYGLYEIFKDQYSNLAGEENAAKYKSLIWLAGSASAEVFADIALCPLEMTKVKIQTSPTGSFPTKFGPALAQMRANAVETRFPFGSLVPLWSRQIPYTMAKFYFFEKTVQLFYTHVFTKPKESYDKGTQLGVTFASGYIAGVVCAIVSHPADSLVSLLGKAENKGKSVGTIASETGIATLATKGLGTRVLMIGTLTGKHIRFECIASVHPSRRLPMVDLRFVQVCHGYGYYWWQIEQHRLDSSFVPTSSNVICIRPKIWYQDEPLQSRSSFGKSRVNTVCSRQSQSSTSFLPRSSYSIPANGYIKGCRSSGGTSHFIYLV